MNAVCRLDNKRFYNGIRLNSVIGFIRGNKNKVNCKSLMIRYSYTAIKNCFFIDKQKLIYWIKRLLNRGRSLRNFDLRLLVDYQLRFSQ